MSQIPALERGNIAVVTGGASGIGLACARRFAGLGLSVMLADLSDEALAAAKAEIETDVAGAKVAVKATDVAKFEDLEALREATQSAFGGPPHVLMNNAAIGASPGGVARGLDAWKRLIDVNLWGVIHGVHAFLPAMVAAGGPRLVINTGSKQGITTPPGNAAYNVSKAGVKVFTEAVAHELRNTPGAEAITAHLLVPGATFTGMTARRGGEKPAGSWTADQVAGFLLERLERGDFYILCPDNDVTRAMDEKRIQWAADDLIRNRPALSRWHPEHAGDFAAWMES
jgi:NAD(P)-dependent dehydrogenase (short-subunit alcohol dehydrogenase family)